MKIAILDYGVGNLRSVNNAVRAIGSDGVVTRDPNLIADSFGLIVPGVGAFGHCMRSLQELDLVDPILKYAASGRPVLGICVGMQMLFARSSEFGMHDGLSLISGQVERIGLGQRVIRLPHIAWAQVVTSSDANHAMFVGIEAADRRFYFVHSYAAVDVPPEFVSGIAEYEGCSVIAAVTSANIWGTQFHPEKSGRSGMAVIANFVAQC